MRVTKRTNIALRLMMYCATHPDQRVTKAAIADCCNISENHLAQVINQLGQLGYLQTQRGRNGGIGLGRPAREISVGAIFRDLEGALPLAECFDDDHNTCPLVLGCRLRIALADAAEAFYASLDDITLEALVEDNTPLRALLDGSTRAAE